MSKDTRSSAGDDSTSDQPTTALRDASQRVRNSPVTEFGEEVTALPASAAARAPVPRPDDLSNPSGYPGII